MRSDFRDIPRAAGIRSSRAGSRKARAALAATAMLVLGAVATPADGGYLAPEWDELYQPSQRIYLAHDPETAGEELVILPGFRGDARDFAWIVPLPAPAEVTEAEPDLFRDLIDLARPRYIRRGGAWDCRREVIDYGIGVPATVDVIDARLVGYYAVLVLGADDAEALGDSLADWGYLHDGNAVEANAALAHYVDKGWSFVAMKVDSAAYAAAFGEPGTYRGMLAPVRFRFTSAEPVVPMRISALSADAYTDIHLYTNAPHRLDCEGFTTRYANRISADEWQEIRHAHRHAGAALAAGDFLTKLTRRYTPIEMTDDLVLERSPDDDEFLPVTYSGWPATPLLFAVPAAYWLVRRRRRR